MDHYRIDRVGGQHSTTKMRFITKAFRDECAPVAVEFIYTCPLQAPLGKMLPLKAAKLCRQPRGRRSVLWTRFESCLWNLMAGVSNV